MRTRIMNIRLDPNKWPITSKHEHEPSDQLSFGTTVGYFARVSLCRRVLIVVR